MTTEELAKVADRFRDIPGRHRAADLLRQVAEEGESGHCPPVNGQELGAALARILFNHPAGGQQVFAELVEGFEAYASLFTISGSQTG